MTSSIITMVYAYPETLSKLKWLVTYVTCPQNAEVYIMWDIFLAKKAAKNVICIK